MSTTPIEQAQDDYFTLTDSIPQASWYWAAMVSIAASASLWLAGQTRLEHVRRPVATDVSAARPVPRCFTQVTPLTGRLQPARVPCRGHPSPCVRRAGNGLARRRTDVLRLTGRPGDQL